MRQLKIYCSRINLVVNQMKVYWKNISAKKVVEIFLISYIKKYNAIITTIEESKDIKKLPATKLIGSLEAFEKRYE